MSATPSTRQRGAHEGLVLQILRDQGPASRTRLSGITGLSPTTITKTVLPMLEAGLLIEQDDGRGRLGRPALSLIPVSDAVTVAGVQIGVGKVRLGLSDGNGVVRATTSFGFDPGRPPVEVLSEIAGQVSALIDADGGAPCIGLGVGAPGTVDVERRRNILSINLGWRDVAIADVLERELDIPVIVDHNVRSFALGEVRYAEHAAESIAYVYVRTGVGFGVAVRGGTFYGGPGSGGESYLGHLRVTEHGQHCTCGAYGCLETVVAEPYVGRQLAALGGTVGPETEMFRELRDLADRRVPGAAELEATIIEHLGNAIATIVNLFTPDLVLIGGALSAVPDSTLAELDATTRERIFPLLRTGLRIETADGDDAALVRGAAAVALEVLHYS